MAITYPRTLPLDGLFRSVRMQPRFNTMTAGLNSPIVEYAPAQWVAEFVTTPLTPPQRRMWEAWINSLRGGVNLFYAWHPGTPLPAAYPDGFGGVTRHGSTTLFDGTATVTGTTTSTIALSGLPSTMNLRAGDKIGLIQGTNRSLHILLEDAVAAAGVVTVTVTPPVPTAVFTAPSAQLVRPVCKMVLTDAGELTDDVEWQPLRFAAIQRLY